MSSYDDTADVNNRYNIKRAHHARTLVTTQKRLVYFYLGLTVILAAVYVYLALAAEVHIGIAIGFVLVWIALTVWQWMILRRVQAAEKTYTDAAIGFDHE